MLPALIVFGITWMIIAFRRLRLLPIGRAGGALFGAVGMVAVGALTPEETWDAIDHDTLALLLGMMIVTAYLQRAGWFDWLAHRALASAGTPMRLLLAVAWLSAFLSAWLVNDTVCLFVTPVVVTACKRAKLPILPYLMAVATSANLGSAATLVGNPQNMLVGSLSGMEFARFLALCGPAAIAGMAVNSALLWAYYGRSLGSAPIDAPSAPPTLAKDAYLVAAVTIGLVAAFALGAHLGYAALGGAVTLFVLDRREPTDVFAAVDWSLLLFFAGLFVVVEGLASTGLVEQAWQALAPGMRFDSVAGIATFTAGMAVGSNIVSNVPLVLLVGPNLGTLGGEEQGWALLGYITTVAGNLTLVGSVANLIVAQKALPDHDLGFFEYLKFGVVSTLLALLVGVPIVVALS